MCVCVYVSRVVCAKTVAWSVAGHRWIIFTEAAIAYASGERTSVCMVSLK